MPFRSCDKISRNFSLAVTMATLRPAFDAAAKIVGARRYRAEFIITSSPVAGSRKKLPLMPWTEGGAPVAMEALLTFVNEGKAARAPPSVHGISGNFFLDPAT